MSAVDPRPVEIRTNSVPCPSCGEIATVTLLKRPDAEQGTEGNQTAFACGNNCERPDEPTLLRLWVAGRRRVKPGR